MSPRAHEPRLGMSPLRLGNPLRNVAGGRDAEGVRYRVNRVTRNLG
jgi:hypothetical protein